MAGILSDSVLLLWLLAPVWLCAVIPFVFLLRRAKPAEVSREGAGELFGLALLGIFGYGFVVHGLRPVADADFTQRAGANLLRYLALALFGAGLAWLQRRHFRERAPLRLDGTSSAVGLGFGALSYVALWPPLMAVFWLEAKIWPEEADSRQPALRLLLEEPRDPRTWILVACVVTVIPFVEELVYRGFLQRGIVAALPANVGRRASTLLATLATSFLFAFAHDPFTRPQIFVLSVVLGWLYARTGSLWVPVGFHALHNLVTIVYAWVTPHLQQQ